MEAEDVFADARESFSDDDNLSQCWINTGAGPVGNDELNFGTWNSNKMLESELCYHPTFSERWCSYKTDTTGNNKIHEETFLRESAVFPREGNAGENLSTYRYMHKVDLGEPKDAYFLNKFLAEPGLPDNMSSSNPEDFSAHSSAAKQAGVLDNITVTTHLGIIYRASISFDYPVKLKTRMEFLFGSSKTKKKRVKNVADVNSHSVPNLRVAADPGDSYGLQKSVTISPVGQWLTNTISRNRKALDTLRSPLFINSSDQDKSIIMQDGSSSTETKEASCSDCDSSFAVGLHNTTSHALSVESMGDTGCDSDTTRQEFSNDVFLSCSSSKTDSNQSSLATSRGFLQCIWEGGIPHFVFSLDDQYKVYLASPCKVESSEDIALNWIYLFHMKASRREKNINGDTRDSEFVGKMKVSSSVSLDCDNASRFVETEYVLFGVTGAHNEELKQVMVNLKPIREKTKGMQKMVTGIFRTPHSSRQQSHSNLIPSSSIYDECPQIHFCEHRKTNLSNMAAEKLLMHQLIPNLEMAAMVVKVRIDQNSNQEMPIGGWGLKFLKERQEDSGFSSNGNRSMQKCKDKPITNMTILVPEDFHGGPQGESSTLLERWRSGGHCDCGGWDVGCPIKVLDGGPCSEESFSHTEPKEACGSFDVFMKGTRESLPALKMVRVCEGLYCVHFQSTLSALQSFSTVVAMIHSQSPPLFSKMYT